MDPEFNFDLVGNKESPFLGYNSANDKTNIVKNMLVRGSQNVYKKLSGTIAVRPGLKRRGTADTTEAGVKSSFEWNTSWAQLRIVRVADGKFQVESDIVTSGTYVWYNLQTSVTLTAYVFDTWWDNTAKKDKLLFVRGDTNIYAWDGGIALISSTSSNTIVLDRNPLTNGFTSTGSISVNGNTYTYTGISTNTLTGVSGNPTGEANGSVVLSSVTTTSNKPAADFTNDFIKVNKNMLGVGSYSSRLFYMSDNADYTSFTATIQGTARAPGDPDTIFLDNNGKGASARSGNFIVTAGTKDWYEISFNQITVGSTLTEQTIVDKKPTAEGDAALRHEFIDTMGDDVLYLDQNHQLRVYGTFRNLNQPRFPVLSLEVQDELAEETFTGGHLRVVGNSLARANIVYITAPVSGRDYMHEIRQKIDSVGNVTAERLWHPPQVRSISRIAVISGVTYGHSSANPQIYQLWDTLQWSDDSPYDEDLNYTARMRLAYGQGQRRTQLITFDKLFVEGYISNGTKLNGYVRYDYQGSGGIQNPIVNSIEQPATYFSGLSSPSIGDGSLGDFPLGEGLSELASDQELLPKFRVINNLTPIDCFEYQIEFVSDDPYSRWEILCCGVNVETPTREPAFITR